MKALATIGLWAAVSATSALATEAGVQRDMYGHRAVAAMSQGAAQPNAPTRMADAGSNGLRGACDADWTNLGPFGGDVQDVAASPTAAGVVLAALAQGGSTPGALYRSTDNGQNWAPVADLGTTAVYDIAFAPDGVIYIGTIDGVWKSVNDGANFTPQSLGIGVNDQVFAVAIDPSNSQTIWCGVADALGSQTVNVMRSTNGGMTWQNRTPPLASPQGCRGIAIHPSDSQRVYAVFGGSFGGGQIWVSSNGGTNWTNRSAGVPANPMNDVVHDGARVIVCGGQLFGGQNVGVWASSNEGIDWDRLHDNTWPSRVVNDIQVDPTNADHLYAATTSGINESIDGGDSWSLAIGGSLPLSCNSVRQVPGDPSQLFVGASSTAVWRSDDGGATFEGSSRGIAQLNVFFAAANPLNPDELAVAFQGLNDGGVYTSLDNGQTWTLEAGLPGTRYNTVRFSPAGVLYAISDGPTSIAPEGLYRRDPGTGDWTSIGPDQGTLFESELFGLRFSNNDPDLILTTGADFGVAGFEPTIWRYDGVMWTKVYEGPSPNERVTDVEIIEDGTDQLMVASFVDFGSSPQTGGALRSDDGGQSWAPSSAGLPAEAQGYAVTLSAGDVNTVYFADGRFGSAGGVYVSTDSGQNWASTGAHGQFLGLEADAYDAAILYSYASDANKVYVSNDAGASFVPFNNGLALAGFGNAISYFDGATPRLFFASTKGAFVTPACGLPAGCPNPGCEVGDLNGDCQIGLEDLATILTNYGEDNPTPGQGDLDDDGDIDISDLATMINVYGAVCD